MKKFKFQLDPVLRLRRNQRELRLQMLADVMRQDGELVALRLQVEGERGRQIDELRELGDVGGINVDASATRRYYAGQLSGDMGTIDRRREILAQQAAACRKALILADQAVKSLEKLAEKRLAEFNAAEERREAIEVEETWRALHAGEGARC